MNNTSEKSTPDSALPPGLDLDAQHRLVFDLVPDGHFLHDGGKILLVNQGGIRMLRAKNANALIGINLLSLVAPEFRELAEERLRLVAAANKTLEPVRMDLLRADGTRMIGKIQGRPVEFSGRRVVLTSVYDITDQAHRDDDLAAAQERAIAASRAKSEFLANISHEFRTPLNSIIGFAELLQREHLGPLGADRYREYTADILESGRQLLSLINDVLDWSRVESGKMQMIEEEIDLLAIARAALRSMREIAAQRGIYLRDRLDELPQAPLLFADPRMTRQVILNLLSNALKFTPEGGVVALQVAHTVTGGLSLTVQDSGIGIAAEDLERVFEPFVQAEGGRQRRYEGTGLGLALARKMMELHGGSLSLESSINRGTLVRMVFPAQRVIDPGAPA